MKTIYETKFDKEYQTQYFAEVNFLTSKGIRYSFVKKINGLITYKYEKSKELFEALEPDYISGITFSGGDPLFEGNRPEIERLAKKVKHEYPDKNIWLYTGYRWEEISALPLVQYVDVLVDGRFMEDLKDTKLHWKGSFNQRIIDVQKSLQNSSLYLYHAE